MICLSLRLLERQSNLTNDNMYIHQQIRNDPNQPVEKLLESAVAVAVRTNVVEKLFDLANYL
jgi:hypothetical protein